MFQRGAQNPNIFFLTGPLFPLHCGWEASWILQPPDPDPPHTNEDRSKQRFLGGCRSRDGEDRQGYLAKERERGGQPIQEDEEVTRGMTMVELKLQDPGTCPIVSRHDI